jgi:hypothetical protein
MSSDQLHKALIYEAHNAQHLASAVRGTAEAGWKAMPFDTLHLAADELDATVGALVLGIDNQSVLEEIEESLLKASDELVIPRAILSGWRTAKNLVREDSSDIIIPKNGAQIRAEVTKWLMLLATKQD